MPEITKPDSQDGLFSFITKGTQLTHASAAFAGGYCLIDSVGAASAFNDLKDSSIEGGEAAKANDVVYLDAWSAAEGNPLAEGDACTPIPYDEESASWVTDRGRSMSRDLKDKTTQGNVRKGEREYALSPLQNETGSISGQYAIGSDFQRQIDSQFTVRMVEAGGKKTRVPISTTHFLTVLFYRQTTVAGEIEIAIFRRMLIQSVGDAGIPQDGNVPYNFDYTTEWKRQVERTISA